MNKNPLSANNIAQELLLLSEHYEGTLPTGVAHRSGVVADMELSLVEFGEKVLVSLIRELEGEPITKLPFGSQESSMAWDDESGIKALAVLSSDGGLTISVSRNAR